MTAKQLTDSILQMAIQGKLVPQDPNDEPASVLLERIREEKRRLVAEGKLKANDIVEKPIEEQDIPYMTPQGWEWIRLNFVSSIARGGSPRPIKEYITDAPNGVNWIKISDTEIGGKYIYKTKEKIKPEGVSRSRFVHKDDFLLTNSMSFGRPYILKTEGCIHDGWLVISLEKDSYDQDFMYYLLSSAFAKKSFSDKAAGAVVKNLNIDKVAESIFPLPPLSEQRRIVEKIEEYLPVIKEYGEAYDEASKMDAELPDKLKKSILQEAIMGKLGTQDPNDAPASCLLEDIRAEKQKLVKEGVLKKKDLIEIAVDEDEVPFSLPESWLYLRLGEVTYNHGQKKPDSDFSYIDIGSIDNKHQRLNDKENILSSKEAPSRARKIVRKGDIIYATVRPYLHNICIIDRIFSKEPIASTGFAVLSCIKGLYNKYLFYYLLSPIFDEYANDGDNAKGMAYPAINDAKLYKGVVPLPPLAEQHRIVQKIEELYAEIDKITINNIISNKTEETEKE